MEITNQLLAAYAEGNVSNEERNAVRQHLTEHPDQLETVMMMMDEDYELEVDDENDVGDLAQSNGVGNFFSNICYSAAAFAPRTMPMKKIKNSHPQTEKSNFRKRLNDLLDDIIG